MGIGRSTSDKIISELDGFYNLLRDDGEVRVKPSLWYDTMNYTWHIVETSVYDGVLTHYGL